MQPPRTFTEGSVAKSLINFAMSLLFTNILYFLNTSINSMWVGRYLGETALAAISNANALMFLLGNTSAGVAMVAAILVAQFIGASRIDEAKRVVGTGTALFVGIAVCTSIINSILLEPLLAAMKTPAEALPLAAAYSRVIFFATPSLFMYSFAIQVLRASGDAKTPFYFLLLSVASDIALNPLLIFGFGPIPRLGVAGSALATVLAQTGSLIALVIHLYRARNVLCLRAAEFSMLRPDRTIARTLIRKGIPISGHVLVPYVSGLLMITLVNRYGVDTTAAYGAALQLWNYIPLVGSAITTSVVTMAAQNIGANRWDRVRSIANIGLVYTALGTSCVIVAIAYLNTHAFELFLPAGSASVHIASHINRIASWSWFFTAVSTLLYGVTRAAGQVTTPLLISGFSLLVVRFPLAVILLDHWQADAIWWSFTISSALDALLAALFYRFGNWRSTQLQTPHSELRSREIS